MASPAIRVAKIAWSIAATIPAARSAQIIKRGDNWKNFKYNFGAKPKPYYEGRNVKAFNGFSIGKGHLAEAKAAINNKGLAGAKSAFQHNSDNGGSGGSCGSGDSSQRDELLAKIAAKKES